MTKAIRRRNTASRSADSYTQLPIANGAVIFGGTLLCWDAGKNGVVSAKNQYGQIFVGVAPEVGGRGDRGDVISPRRSGVFQFDTYHAFTQKDLFRRAYVMDDQTVGNPGDNSKGPFCGVIVEVSDDGTSAWILIDPAIHVGFRRD